VNAPLVDFIEAAYDLDAPTNAWLERLGWGVRNILRDGLGVIGFRYDASDSNHVRLSSLVTLERNETVLRSLEAAHRVGPAWGVRRLYWGGVRCTTVSQALGIAWRAMPVFRAFVAPFGVRDFFALRASDPGQTGVLLSTALRKEKRVPRRDADLWERLGAHVAAGVRLRDRARETPDDSAAVLRPDGALEHAQGDATDADTREALTDATKRIDRARGRMRREDPEGATRIWHALVEGRWSLVDWIDHDGKRYVLARENPPPVPPATPLTARERQVLALVAQGDSNKLVGYELGMAEATVAVHVWRASNKLGASSRVGLIRAYRALVAAEVSDRAVAARLPR
jgi:DNA-binding CsgD family transcriptional regulator